MTNEESVDVAVLRARWNETAKHWRSQWERVRDDGHVMSPVGPLNALDGLGFQADALLDALAAERSLREAAEGDRDTWHTTATNYRAAFIKANDAVYARESWIEGAKVDLDGYDEARARVRLRRGLENLARVTGDEPAYEPAYEAYARALLDGCDT